VAVLILFIVISIFLCVRKVDGAGVVQTPEMRNITLIIWGVFGLIILICYLIWLAVLKHSK
jgi:cytochrome c-type biogenesis protein CcmH/NrfF